MLLGEIIDPNGNRYDLQLKGSGPTPYSRGGDGRSPLGPVLREYVLCEAMHALGIPTTRALAAVSTGEQVRRETFLPGAVLARVASSHIRIGTFQFMAAQDDPALLETLMQYTLKRHFPDSAGDSNPALALLNNAILKQAQLIARWQLVGFIHGVMNTDNMSILGLTIDYGPYGWLESYDPNWTPNTTDASNKRYRYSHQAQIAQWNLVQLANALYPLIEDTEPLKRCINDFASNYAAQLETMRAAKLGLLAYRESDSSLIANLHKILQLVETDMTLFYRGLADLKVYQQDQTDAQLMAPLAQAYYVDAQLTTENKTQICQWLRQYQQRVRLDVITDESRRKEMNTVNPKYVFRNYLAQLATDKAEQGDFSLVKELLEVLRHPYDEQPDKTHFSIKRPDWARQRAGCSMLSCSS